ncbi:hypothetical protein SMU36_09617 [Streptococcus mutans 4VF1]|nr:hypothetical protein SMU36_09617 [Streptococcus mutans 4VF1]EMC30223.1 hypothetical protein SMU89_09730 [Streptococcus mutans NLML1]OVE99527.1 hypothetical protein CAV53_10040 [Streptococcus mutans]
MDTRRHLTMTEPHDHKENRIVGKISFNSWSTVFSKKEACWDLDFSYYFFSITGFNLQAQLGNRPLFKEYLSYTD